MHNRIHPIVALGALHVHWRLINASNMAIPGLCDINCDNNCVYMRERILRMAERVIEQPRPYYAVTITGGEPTLHPFLPEITRYLLSTSRKVGLTIETNGSQDLSYYEGLIHGLPPASLRLSLAACPSGDPCNLAKIIACAVQHGQLAHVRLYHGQDLLHNNEFYKNLLLHIPADMPVSWESKTLKEFASHRISYTPEQQEGRFLNLLSGTYDIEANACLNPSHEGESYCCQGTNFLYIAADGYFYGAQCSMTCSPLPLWHDDAKLSTERIFHCPLSKCVGGINNILPKFAQLRDAQDFFCQYEAQKQLWSWQEPPLYSEQWQRPDVKRQMWLRMSRLNKRAKPASDVKLSPCPHMLQGQMEVVVNVYKRLNDNDSREVFLRVLKAMQSGDSGFLPGEDYNKFSFHNPPLVVQVENIEQFRPMLVAEQHDVDICLNMDCSNFVDNLLRCLDALHDYEWHMAFSDGKLHLLAAGLPKPWKVEAYRPGTAEINVSVIIACSNAQDSLGRSLDSALLQNLPGLEIIVVAGYSDDATLDVTAQRQSIAKGVIRLFHTDGQMGLPQMMQLGLNEAKGKFVLFLKPGDVLGSSCVESQMLAGDGDKDLIVANTILLQGNDEKTVRVSQQGGSAPVAAFLQAWANGFALGSCLVKRELLFANKIYPAGIIGNVEMWLGAHIFACAENLVVCEETGVTRWPLPILEDSNVNELGLIVDCLQTVDALARIFGLSASITNQCAKEIINICLPTVLARLNTDEWADIPEESQKAMRTLAGNRQFIDSLLVRASTLFCNQSNLHPVVKDLDADLEIAAIDTIPPIRPAAYHHNCQLALPKISIILYNCNGDEHLGDALDSIFSQSMRDYEVIAVDDGSTDGSLETLQDYAEACPSLQLYGFASEMGIGFCHNFAFSRATGDYCLFMDSCQILHQGFLANVAAASGASDIIIYSAQNILPDGQASWIFTLVDENLSGAKAWHLYESQYIVAQSAAVVYRTAFAKAAGCEFGRYVYHSADYFLITALTSARRISSSSFIASSARVKQDFNPEVTSLDYWQIYSELRLQQFIETQHGKVAEGQIGPAGLTFKNRFFPPIYAIYKAGGNVPLSDEDYELLRGMPALVRALLADYARQNAWEFVKPSVRIALPCLQAPRPLVSIFWQGNQSELLPFIRSFLEQDLRDLELIIVGDEGVGSIMDARIKCQKKFDINEAEGEFVVFADYGSRLEHGDILRATAILRQNPEQSFACFIESAPSYREMEPGVYTGRDLLALHTNAENVPLHWQACVFRKSFLVENDLTFATGSGAGEVFMLRALQKAAWGVLLLPEEPHARRLRFKPGPEAPAAFRQLAVALVSQLKEMPFLSASACQNLLSKFMREWNLVAMAAHEVEALSVQ